MALIAAGSVVSDIRGSIAGTTYSRNKGGLYARARVAPINRNTPAQTLVRNNFATNAKLWSGTFTADERAAWTAFAAANPLVNILGASIIVSGLAMAQKLNQVLSQVGAATITAPPPDLSVPALAPASGVVVDDTGPTMEVTTTAQAVVAGAKYYIFATPGLSPGKTPQTSQFRYIGAYAGVAAATSVSFVDNWQLLFGAVPATGLVVGVLVATVNTESGAVTPGLRFNAVGA